MLLNRPITFHIITVQYVLACAYLLCEIPIYQLVTGYHTTISAQHIFGGVAVEKAMHVLTTESTRTGRGVSRYVSVATCSALLANRNPVLEKLSLPILEKLYETYSYQRSLRTGYIVLSRLLYNIKVIPNCLPTPYNERGVTTGKDDILSADWTYLIQAWYDNSTDSIAVRKRKRSAVAKAARWAARKVSRRRKSAAMDQDHGHCLCSGCDKDDSWDNGNTQRLYQPPTGVSR